MNDGRVWMDHYVLWGYKRFWERTDCNCLGKNEISCPQNTKKEMFDFTKINMLYKDIISWFKSRKGGMASHTPHPQYAIKIKENQVNTPTKNVSCPTSKINNGSSLRMVTVIVKGKGDCPK